MQSIFSVWWNFNFTREAVQSCEEDIRGHNLRSLMIISMLSAVLIGIFLLFFVLTAHSSGNLFIYLGAAAIELLVFFYARYLKKHDRISPLLVQIGFFVLFISLMAFGIYTSLLSGLDEPSDNFLVFLVCSQIIFVFNPVRNLLLNAGVILAVSLISYRVKPLSVWRIDLMDLIILCVFSMIFAWYMSHVVIKEMLATRRLEIERNRFREESIKDELTGLSNRRDYQHAVVFYISVCQHVHQTVCTIMMDVDYFKRYNDFYGHQKGDLVLQAVGKVLQRLTEEERVFAARVGGEEFIVLWTENRIAEAERVALKLRQMIIDLRIPHAKSSVAPYITASLGMYILRGGAVDSTDELYNYADTALYEAKKRGRNCIMLRDSADDILRMVEILPPGENLGRRRGALDDTAG
jgi:diguanylate cyclase (GGDEF)-like protein